MTQGIRKGRSLCLLWLRCAHVRARAALHRHRSGSTTSVAVAFTGPWHLGFSYVTRGASAFAFATIVAASSATWRRPCACGEAEDQDDDDEEEFTYQFAKDPVEPAASNSLFSVSLQPAEGGGRPITEVVASSTFSLPVERGWPRDILSPSDVATSMSEVLADRLPRWVSQHFDLELAGAPMPLRGLQAWPRLGVADTGATLRHWLVPPPLPPLVSLQLSDHGPEGVAFALGGLACAGACGAKLQVLCEVVGTVHSGAEERLDLRLTTRLSGIPAAGRAWSFLGCGGRWWFERVRLPFQRRLLEEFHAMAREQMMVHYVAALSG